VNLGVGHLERRHIVMILGIFPAKDFMYFCVLDGSKAHPKIIERNRLSTPAGDNLATLSNWYYVEIGHIFARHKISGISFKYVNNPNKDQIIFSCMPLGCIALIASQKNIPVSGIMHQSFVPSRLNLPRTISIIDHCDVVFGKLSPHWNSNSKNATIVAWMALP
jgi:hypothetical protein